MGATLLGVVEFVPCAPQYASLSALMVDFFLFCYRSTETRAWVTLSTTYLFVVASLASPIDLLSKLDTNSTPDSSVRLSDVNSYQSREGQTG